MDAIETLLAENGVRTDLETAVYYADHDIRAGEALALAEQAHRERPSIQADDALAWTLYRNERCEEALRCVEAGAAARNRRRGALLPPRHDRALPRQRGRSGALAHAGRSRPTRASRCCSRRSRGRFWRRTRHEEADRDRRRAAGPARPGGRLGAPARQLHGQPFHAHRGVGRPPLPALRARHGGDPDLPGSRRGCGEGRGGLRARPGRRSPRRPVADRGRQRP